VCVSIESVSGRIAKYINANLTLAKNPIYAQIAGLLYRDDTLSQWRHRDDDVKIAIAIAIALEKASSLLLSR